MHDSDQHQTSLRQPPLVTHLVASLDHAAALQSLELQRLKLILQRRRTPVSTLDFEPAIIPLHKADIVVRSRRAA